MIIVIIKSNCLLSYNQGAKRYLFNKETVLHLLSYVTTFLTHKNRKIAFLTNLLLETEAIHI